MNAFDILKLEFRFDIKGISVLDFTDVFAFLIIKVRFWNKIQDAAVFLLYERCVL